MRVHVKLFAGARELVGQESVALELPPRATVGVLRERLIESHPKLGSLASHALFAIEAAYCDNETPIPENAEIACIPPVSGG